MPGKSALIFGASGVSGWSFVNEILNDYPEKGVWDKVHALTNRPLSLKDSMWPDDPRLNIVSGIDLLKGSQEELEQQIKERVQGADSVTHVYYLAYKANKKDPQQELKDAEAMFRRSTTAMDHLSSALEFVVLQTGAKMYGCNLLNDRPEFMVPPLAESLPRLPQPYHDQMFYHHQLDWVQSYAASKSWNWCDTRPDIIVGFVPNQNAYSLGTVLGIYFSLYREVEGAGAECPFPGTEQSWITKSIDSSADMIARQTIHLSLTLPASRKGEGFNVADAREPQNWSTKWPQLCAYFGLKGSGPLSSRQEAEKHEVRRYINEHMDTWHALESKHGLRRGIADSNLVYEGFERFLLTDFDVDRHYDMTKMYETTGFKEEFSVMDAWGTTFDRMRSGKIIP